MNFEETWGELETKYCFQRQSWTRYIAQTLVFMQDSAMREGFNFYFSAYFC